MNSTKDIIKHIVIEYGTDIFYNPQKFSALLMDLMSDKTKERNILKIAIVSGVPSKILVADSLDNSDKKLVSSKCKLFLCENYGIEEAWSTFAIDCFTYALGWENNVVDEDIILAKVIQEFLK